MWLNRYPLSEAQELQKKAEKMQSALIGVPYHIHLATQREREREREIVVNKLSVSKHGVSCWLLPSIVAVGSG